MSKTRLAKHARSKIGAYQAPTSSAFGGKLGPANFHPVGNSLVPGATPGPAAATAPATIPAPPDPSGATPGHVDPFFRPEDLITQDNFWAQWNTTFGDLDRQLGDLQRNTAFNRAQLADSHKSNVSGINDDAAARGVSHSSIRDGSQAQEQTNFTRADTKLTDDLNAFAQYVQGQKDNFNTNTLPAFNSAEDAQAVQNAQDVPTAPAPAAPKVASQAPQAETPIYKAVIRNGWLWHDYPDGHKVKVRPAGG